MGKDPGSVNHMARRGTALHHHDHVWESFTWGVVIPFHMIKMVTEVPPILKRDISHQNTHDTILSCAVDVAFTSMYAKDYTSNDLSITDNFSK